MILGGEVENPVLADEATGVFDEIPDLGCVGTAGLARSQGQLHGIPGVTDLKIGV